MSIQPVRAATQDLPQDAQPASQPSSSVCPPAFPHLRHNYLCHSIEGGLFVGGMAFTNSNTLLPAMISWLHGPPWLVTLMPVGMYLGFRLPPIFTAHWIDRMSRYMPLLCTTGVVQRIPFLFAALALWFAADTLPALALAAVALAPFISGFMGGISVTAWQQLLIKTIPQHRRSSLFAWRYIVSCPIAVAAGYIAKVVLRHYPGTDGYALLHFFTFLSLMGSYTVFCMIREQRCALPASREPVGMIDNLRAMPDLLRRHPDFCVYLLSAFFRNGVFIVVPFLAIHAQTTLGKPESYIGQLVIVQMIGAIGGNLAAGWVGDRFGCKIVYLAAGLILVVVSGWSAQAHTDLAFQIIFFLFGIGFYASEVANQILAIEFSPEHNRSSYLALGSLVNLPSMLLAAFLSTLLWRPGGNFAQLALVTAIFLAVCLLLILPIREPRQFHAASGENQ